MGVGAGLTPIEAYAQYQYTPTSLGLGYTHVASRGHYRGLLPEIYRERKDWERFLELLGRSHGTED
jgi:hypothetical protein